MARRKRERIPENSRDRKAGFGPHNNRAGVSAFKKRMRVQYGRREGKRGLKELASDWERLAPARGYVIKSGALRPSHVERLEAAGFVSRGIHWSGAVTIAEALRAKGKANAS